METDKRPLQIKGNSALDTTSKFSSFANLNDIDVKKLSIIKNKFSILVKHAERESFHNSMSDIFENINENYDLDLLKGKHNPLKEKALNHLKRSNSFISNHNPNSFEINNQHIKDKNKQNGGKIELNTQNRVASSSEVFDILNDEYIKQKYKNLNKTINNQDKIFQNKETNININKIKKDMFYKEKVFVEKKTTKINNLRNKILSQEQASQKPTPGIDNGSLKIINKKLKDKKPIYERFDEIKNEKKEKLEKYKKNLERNNSAKNLDSKNYSDLDLNNKNVNDTNNNTIKDKKLKDPNHFNEWLKNNNRWNNQKQKKNLDLKKRLEEHNKGKEDSLYTPKINKMSDIIANNRNFYEFPGMEVYDKLYNQKDFKLAKQKYLLEKSNLSFIPVINNYTPNYLNNFSKKDSNKKLIINEDNLINYNRTLEAKNKDPSNKLIKKTKINESVNRECAAAYEKNNNTLISNKKDMSNENSKFIFTLYNKDIRSSSQGKINSNYEKLFKKDITFFETSKDNKIIFYE